MIECNIFGAQYNQNMIDDLRKDYVKNLTFGENLKPPQRRFIAYSSHL